MIGTFFKYVAVAAAGAVTFAVAMHYVDDAAVVLIDETIKQQVVLYRAGNPTDEELANMMRVYIAANRKMWDGTYQLKDTAERVEALYAVWA